MVICAYFAVGRTFNSLQCKVCVFLKSCVIKINRVKLRRLRTLVKFEFYLIFLKLLRGKNYFKKYAASRGQCRRYEILSRVLSGEIY